MRTPPLAHAQAPSAPAQDRAAPQPADDTQGPPRPPTARATGKPSALPACARRRAAELEHERRNHDDLVFMAWVREASTSELTGQARFAVGWQRVAVERELGRRTR
jgi:hypothetical protein